MHSFRLAVAAFVLGGALAEAQPIVLEVDAREAPRKVFHARMTVPASAGALVLFYPKWIPGEHGPTGPIADLAGLVVTAAGRTLPWRRDPVEMHAVQVDVPGGAGSVEVALDYLSPPDTGGFSSGASATANLAVVSWNQVLLYPRGRGSDDLTYAASLRLPGGWKFGTALPVARTAADRVEFAPVSLTTLVDSPALIGAHLRTIELPGDPIAHRMWVAADSEAALEMKPEQLDHYRRLVAETGALFGARHYRSYGFLLTLSDHTAHFGLEHHESSDNRIAERSLLDDDLRRASASLLSHEMTHSWNGKYRRPAGLATGDFEKPMVGDLLWVYEGLTQYLGDVLAARSGLRTVDEYHEALALTAAEMDHREGRAWRPLADTAVAAQALYGARGDWAAWRRGVDFYPESELLWLEADTLIRRETGGRKSLDDFCRLFHGGASGPPRVVPYTFEDVVAALNQVAPFDWAAFWKTRLNATGKGAVLAGVEASGWKVVYGEARSQMQKSFEEAQKTWDVRYSLGFSVREDGTILDVLPSSPAGKAGVGPGTRLLAVNGRRWSKETLRDAIRETRTRSAPVELLIENGEFFRTYRLEYSGGERYPRLEAAAGRADVLSDIIRAHAPSR
jgi:predicted metalloprotease with PDZ domain